MSNYVLQAKSFLLMTSVKPPTIWGESATEWLKNHC